MSLETYFKKQVDGGTTDFWYCIETLETEDKGYNLAIKRHQGTPDSLDAIGTNLEFVRMEKDTIPVFKEI